MTVRQHDGVALPEGLTGSTFLHQVLAETIAAFPAEFGDCGLPEDPRDFKKAYADVVTRFESARTSSSRRAEIATFAADLTFSKMCFLQGDTRIPLADHLATAGGPLDDAHTHAFEGPTGWVPEVPFRGRTYVGHEIHELVTLLESEHLLSDTAAQGLRWVTDHTIKQGGALDLTGHRFALLGAGAEMAPVEFLLRAGATVLWIDLRDAHEALAERCSVDQLSGTLVTVPDASDLLQQTAATARAVARFAAEGPVHLGLFAYAPGRGRELRLAAAMEGVVRALPPGSAHSIGMYISPTTPAAVADGELESASARARDQSFWKRALGGTPMVDTRGHEGRVARTTVNLQGPGYLAAQYLTKVLMAERWATVDSQPMTVSANIAGITNTRSLHHPLFQVAFAGAPTFGIQIFETETTRPLSGLLWLRDLLDDQAPGARTRRYESLNDRAAGAMSQQIHGGVLSQPWALESVIQTAAVVGATKRPGLLLKR